MMKKSYICGMVNVYSWIVGTSAIAVLAAQGILAIVSFYRPDYEIHTWHSFLIFQAVNLLAFVHNTFTIRRTLWINDVACKYPLPYSQRLTRSCSDYCFAQSS